MRIALVTDGIFPYVMGGMQKHSYNLCKHFVAQGVELVLLHCITDDQPLPTTNDLRNALECDEKADLNHHCRKFPRHSSMPGHYLRESQEYSQWCYDQIADTIGSFDAIYCKGFAASHFARLKSQGQDLPPLLVKFHGYEMFQPAADFRRKAESLLLRWPVKYIHKHCDFVMSYGGKITQLIEEKLDVDKSKIIDIPTGIDPSWIIEEKAPLTGPIKFLFVGRYERRKGIVELHKVLGQISPDNDFEFDFIGPIPEENQIAHPKVKYHGSIMDANIMRTEIDKCHILVTPSHSEGMPNVIMEGMARGLAILATDTGAVCQMVDEQNGWLITPGDEDELAKTLHKCLETPLDIIREKGEKSVMKCRTLFRWDKVALQTINSLTERLQLA